MAPGVVIVLIPEAVEFRQAFDEAISPALADCGFRSADAVAFDSKSWVSDAVRWILGAEMVVADVTDRNPDVMYLLGLCHGLGRCPLLISQNLESLPFNLAMLRCVSYVSDKNGLQELRERLARAIRVFAAEAAASRKQSAE